MYGFVIGNGESRKGFDLNLIKNEGQIYGCNALYRDFSPHSIVTVDMKITDHLRNRKNDFDLIFFERGHGKLGLLMKGGGYTDLGRYKSWAAGPTAAWSLCKRMAHHIHIIFLIGFDFYSRNDKINNVYKGTKFYRKASERSVNPKNWIHQFKMVFHEFRDKEFIRVMPDGWSKMKEFKRVENYTEINYEQMLELVRGG